MGRKRDRNKKPPSLPAPPSLGEKLGHLADSNLTWGAVGMILAGVGAYLGVAFLVVGGWIALTVAIWRTNFFEGRAKRVQWFGNLFISLLVAAVLIVIVMFLQPKMPNPFNAEMRVVMGSPDAGPLSYYMV